MLTLKKITTRFIYYKEYTQSICLRYERRKDFFEYIRYTHIAMDFIEVTNYEQNGKNK